jgi:beta-ureidopropionase
MGPFYGSAYLATPEGERSVGLPRDKDGILICEIDLNQCRQSRDLHTFRMCQRLPLYAEGLANACKLDFKPQVIKEQ